MAAVKGGLPNIMKIKITDDKCRGCGACITQCHANTLSLDLDTSNRKKVSAINDDCDGCGACLPMCRYGALALDGQD